MPQMYINQDLKWQKSIEIIKKKNYEEIGKSN